MTFQLYEVFQYIPSPVIFLNNESDIVSFLQEHLWKGFVLAQTYENYVGLTMRKTWPLLSELIMKMTIINRISLITDCISKRWGAFQIDGSGLLTGCINYSGSCFYPVYPLCRL